MNKKIKVGTFSQQMSEKYNPYQSGYGEHESNKDKLRRRNSKQSQQLRKEMKAYCR